VLLCYIRVAGVYRHQCHQGHTLEAWLETAETGGCNALLATILAEAPEPLEGVHVVTCLTAPAQTDIPAIAMLQEGMD